MAMAPQSPSEAARSRYNSSFSSKIFEPLPQNQSPRFVPAGKRRDQTTAEMFGTYHDKDLHASPKTFQPKEDKTTTREKRMNFLHSEVLPVTKYPMSAIPPVPAQPRVGDMLMPADTDETIDPNVRRQKELSSGLFGRASPTVEPERVHDKSQRLTPNDFKWFNVPEEPSGKGPMLHHKDRSYQEKCSQVLNYSTPIGKDQETLDYERKEREIYEDGEAKRRANIYYSDLFGRETPMDAPGAGGVRARKAAPPEERIIIHQDWTDSKTELMSGARKGLEAPPNYRRGEEFNASRIFEANGIPVSAPMGPRPDSLTTDNSMKIKEALGGTAQEIHQAHLRTSMTPKEFYDAANSTRAWEVLELHVSGLPREADEPGMKRLCHGFDLQIVKVALEMDPVTNTCKGRAKVMVRYNPAYDSVSGLVQKLESAGFYVQL
mmetsp:Transcript_75891/g.180342  ORF Transcript_75891/g.180342 Transcript_75891/m.180342 type:complete len:434 (+) Transcript_75891:97-1398(+)|eukprot:CAMPEP_0178445184 /NCGR_PEP_ID=MMETSP0689_2-20121128/39999_1 /TAXON_ID=160604 /ORGANISM="Amphidinium massartii, Strain CS-259" /LENGTH=433 /DNA_ID=CAMNT_0020069653 /DNA_START=58 /DNA_END=1359 /DNA_ORIENTATION=+